MKEQLRRKGENDGFSQAPGDCLAYKYYRDVSNLPLLFHCGNLSVNRQVKPVISYRAYQHTLSRP